MNHSILSIKPCNHRDCKMKKGCNIMQQLKTKRVGIYACVSTEMQSTEGYSVDLTNQSNQRIL